MPKKEIFVSSTFRDFQTERDLLNNDFSNIINDTLKNKIGMTVSFLDLRYGVNTYGKDENERIKSATISSIQGVYKTKPFFIIFIGNRYGSLVDNEALSTIYKFFMNSCDNNNKSITEVEFDFSSFNSSIDIEKNHCFLIKRNIINDNKNSNYFDENQKLVNDLLAKAKDKCIEENYIEYDAYINDNNSIDIDEENKNKLISFLTKRLLRLLDNNIPANDFDLEQRLFEGIYDNENYTFIDRDDAKFILSIINENKLLSIEGKHGYGKTALVCYLADRIKTTNSFSYYFLTKNSITRCNTARVFKYFLRCLLNDGLIDDKYNYIDKLNDLELISYFYESINNLDLNNNYYFFIDDIDKLFDYKDNYYPIDSLLVPNNCHFIFTSSKAIKSEANVIIENVRINDIKKYFLKRASALGKLLPDRFLDGLENFKFDNQNLFRNPLYLSMVLDNILALNENDFRLLNTKSNFEDALSELLFTKISEHNSDIEEELIIMLDKIDNKNSKAILSALALFSEVGIDDFVNYYKEINESFFINDFYNIRNSFSNIITKNYNGKYTLYNDLFKPIILKYYYNNDNNSINEFKYNFLKYGILNSSIDNKIEAYSIIESIKDIKAYKLLLGYLDSITEFNDNGIIHNILGDCIIEYTLLEVIDNPNDNLILNLLGVDLIKNYKNAFNYLSIYLLKLESANDYTIKNSIKINELFMNLCNEIGYQTAPAYKMGLTIYLLAYSYLLNFDDRYVGKAIDFCNQFLSATGLTSYAMKIINLDFKRIQKCHNLNNLKKKIDFIPMVYQYLAGKKPNITDITMFMDTICGVWDSLISIDINTYYKDNQIELESILKPLDTVTTMMSNYLDKIVNLLPKGDYYKYKLSFISSKCIVLNKKADIENIKLLYDIVINERIYLIINQSLFNTLELLVYSSMDNSSIIDINKLISRVISLVDEAIVHQANDIETLRMIVYVYKTLFSIYRINDIMIDNILNQYNSLIDNYQVLLNKCIYSLEYNKVLEELIYINTEIIIINYCRNNNVLDNKLELQKLLKKIPDNLLEGSKAILINNLYNYKQSINGIIASTNSNISFEDVVRLFNEL